MDQGYVVLLDVGAPTGDLSSVPAISEIDARETLRRHQRMLADFPNDATAVFRWRILRGAEIIDQEGDWG